MWLPTRATTTSFFSSCIAATIFRCPPDTCKRSSTNSVVKASENSSKYWTQSNYLAQFENLARSKESFLSEEKTIMSMSPKFGDLSLFAICPQKLGTALYTYLPTDRRHPPIHQRSSQPPESSESLAGGASCSVPLWTSLHSVPLWTSLMTSLQP